MSLDGRCENNHKMEVEDKNIDDNNVVIVLDSSEDEGLEINCAPIKEEDVVKVEYDLAVGTHPVGYLNIPIYSKTNPSLREIFNICLLRQDDEIICKQRPFGIKSKSTFIVNQRAIHLNHPFDLDADDSISSSKKTEFVRFYEVSIKDGDLEISSEVIPRKTNAGIVVGGTYRERNEAEWLKREANVNNLYALIRRRAVDKTLKT